jgi:hypothetical protein
MIHGKSHEKMRKLFSILLLILCCDYSIIVVVIIGLCGGCEEWVCVGWVCVEVWGLVYVCRKAIYRFVTGGDKVLQVELKNCFKLLPS